MRVAIIPRITELKIIVNPAGEVTREAHPCIMPGLYAPWPDAQKKGVIEMVVEGETLRALLTKLSEQYRQVSVDFEPIKSGTGNLDSEYDVYVDDKDCVTLPHGLDSKLTTGNEVVVSMVWHAG